MGNNKFCTSCKYFEKSPDNCGRKNGKYGLCRYGTRREHAKHEISEHTYKITYILNGWGIKNGYVVLGIKEY